MVFRCLRIASAHSHSAAEEGSGKAEKALPPGPLLTCWKQLLCIFCSRHHAPGRLTDTDLENNPKPAGTWHSRRRGTCCSTPSPRKCDVATVAAFLQGRRRYFMCYHLECSPHLYYKPAKHNTHMHSPRNRVMQSCTVGGVRLQVERKVLLTANRHCYNPVHLWRKLIVSFLSEKVAEKWRLFVIKESLLLT
jgi:hypothetical protein